MKYFRVTFAGCLAVLLMFMAITIGYIQLHRVPNIPQRINFPTPWFQINEKSALYDVDCYALTCEVYFASSIGEPSNYRQLVKLIETAPKEATINFHLDGNGGYFDTVTYIYNAIKISKGTINTIVDGPVYSAHAYLAVMGKHITIVNNSLFLFHVPAIVNPNTNEPTMMIDACSRFLGSKDRGQDALVKCVQLTRLQMLIFTDFCNDNICQYLAQQEKDNLYQGFDIYITSSDMIQRLKQHNK